MARLCVRPSLLPSSVGETQEKSFGGLPNLWSRSSFYALGCPSTYDVTCALDPFVKVDNKKPDQSPNTVPLLCPPWWQCSEWEAPGDSSPSYLSRNATQGSGKPPMFCLWNYTVTFKIVTVTAKERPGDTTQDTMWYPGGGSETEKGTC